jgi:dihydroxyacetone kinase-like predicted kinase
VASDVAGAATALLEYLLVDEPEIVTVVEGEGSTEVATRQIIEWLGAHHPGVGVQVLRGDQPLCPYLFGVE